MERINCTTIDQVFEAPPNKKTDFEKIKNILISIIDSLSVLHSKGIVCGDLKPTHIFVDNKNNVKLIDPGFDPDIITPAYTAPEALTDSPTFSSDIYSIGVILYEILTGEKAFKGNLSKIIEDKLKKGLSPPEEKNPAIPSEMNLLILRMTSKELNNRLRNIEEVKIELALGAPSADKTPSFIPVFTGREKEIKEFDLRIKKIPEPRILWIEGKTGIGKTALLNQFKIRALCGGIGVKEVTPGELYSLLNEKKLLEEPHVLFLDNISSSSDISGILKSNAINIRANPLIIVINLDNKISDIKEFSDITSTFTLKPLNNKEISSIIDKNFPQFEKKKELISFLAEQSRGNPSLINQTIEILIEEGVIERKGDKIIFKQNRISFLPLPKSIEENLKLQIRKLPKQEKELLEILSVFPEKISVDLISFLKVKNFQIIINSLISRNILQKDKKGIYFKNEWIRDFLYKELTKKDKENIYKKVEKKISFTEFLYILQKDLGLKEDYRQSLIQMAKRKIKEKEYPQAIKFLNEALSVKDDMINKIILARVLELAGNINEALLLYKKLSSEEENTFYLLKIGDLAERMGKKKETEKYFRKAVELAKGKAKAQAVYWLGYFLVRKNKLNEASKLISYFKKTEGELTLRLKFVEGRLLCAKGDFEKALKIAEEALKQDLSPVMKRHFLTLGGIVKQQNEEHQEAIEYFQKNIDLAKNERDPMHESTYTTYKAFSILKLDRYGEALEELEEAFLISERLKIELLESNCLGQIFIVYLQIGYWEKIKERIEDFRKRNGKVFPYLKEKLLYSRLYIGDWEGVEKIQRELNKEKHDINDGKGIIFAFKKEWEKAEENFKKCKRKWKGYPEYVRNINWRLSEVLFEQGKKEEAIYVLKPYIEKIESIQSSFEKGKILSSWGLITGDIKSIDRAIKLFSAVGLPFYTARARLKKARVLMEGNKIDEAIEELKKAEKIFKELKAGLFLDKTNELFVECAKKTWARSGYIHTYEEISKLLSSIDSEKRFDEALAILTDFFNAERGAIILREREKKNIIISSYKIDRVTLEDARRISSTVTKKVAKGEVVIAGNAVDDSRFSDMDSIKRNKIRSILCVPIISEKKIYGALYLDSTINKDIFLSSDKEFLQSIGRILGILFSKGDILYRIKEEVKHLRRMTSFPESFHSIIGISKSMQNIYKTIEEIAETDINVMIAGETGTGKELIARTIHNLSKRKNRPFVTIDCGSLSETLLQSELFGHKKGSFTGAIKDKKGICEVANGGTLFLDEIGDAPASIQSGLLRVTDRGEIRRIGETEFRRVDLRVISATNKNLEQEVIIKNFREDFFYRLNQIEINIPPLRERKDDINLILNYYLDIFANKKRKKMKGFRKEAMSILENYSFPGNVRELKNIVELALIKTKSKYISEDDLPQKVLRECMKNSKSEKKQKLKAILNSYERTLIVDSLKRNNWNITRTAKDLQISRRSLQLKIKKFDIVFEE